MTDVNRVNFDQPKSKAEKRKAKHGEAKNKPKPLKERIPVLPKEPPVDPSQVGDADQRAIACANMKLAGAPFHEIAKELGYASASTARAAYIAALANMFPMEDLETLRQTAAQRSDIQFRRSLAMASATHLVDETTGEKIPNTDRLRWHEQAGKDLALWTMITGAKAPAKMEVSVSGQELNQIVHLLVQNNPGEHPAEADVWKMAELEELEAEIVEDED